MTRRAFVLPVLLASILVGGAITAWAPCARAADGREAQVKAALLYQITRMVEWPDSVRAGRAETLRIGVLRDDAFRGAMTRAVADRPGPFGNGIEVVAVDDVDGAKDNHVLFVPRGADDEVLAALRELRREGILLVGEESRFAEGDGGIIALVPDGRTMAMVLNIGALADSGLHARSRFLRLCRIVGDEAR